MSESIQRIEPITELVANGAQVVYLLVRGRELRQLGCERGTRITCHVPRGLQRPNLSRVDQPNNHFC